LGPTPTPTPTPTPLVLSVKRQIQIIKSGERFKISFLKIIKSFLTVYQ